MGSELGVGHHSVGGGERAREVAARSRVASWESTYEIHDGRYRFARVFGGLNWNPDLRAPADRARRRHRGGRVPARGGGRAALRAGERLQPLREHRRPHRGDPRRPPRRRHRLADRAGGASRQRAGAAAPACLGGGQPASVSTRPPTAASPTSTCPTPPARDMGTSSATSFRSPTKQATDPRRPPQQRRPDRRLLHRHPAAAVPFSTGRCATATIWRRRWARSRVPRSMLIDENAASGGDLLPWMFRQAGWGRSSAAAPGAAWSASWASRS